ncbi:precorrin-8X methylmutase [uncultured Ferrovibrio sp.]|jgi:precorrin-8X/cobalt-precorrin-8 methylmutase|uniref:precorrin-8X methylmutase n=1 Tax=uncultured Ferrovibrio sp. TaxID=1576913 RepID=UPI002630DC97|nr:precorrin-8X methylmutase [uncultured Ferrovibrio sp.]
MKHYDYLRDPDAIYRLSFDMIRREVDLSALPPGIDELALRLIHACAMPDILPDLVWTPDLPRAVHDALQAGRPILSDVDMVAYGVIRSRLPASNPVLSFLNTPQAREIGKSKQITRSAAAVELWLPHLENAVVVIGNAPTALFRLLELLHDGAPKPAAILGFPVGFVGAAESKQALIEDAQGVPYATLKGRRGGSAIAAAAINALASWEPPR